jgi:hypothetical protein
MSNFSSANGQITYSEPEGTDIYMGKIVLMSEYAADNVGLCISMRGGGSSVAVGIKNEDDIQEFLYSAAVKSKLIKEGDPLILMKKVSAE